MLKLDALSVERATTEQFHDGLHEETARFRIACSCGCSIEQNALAAISTGQVWYRRLPRDSQRYVAGAFEFTFSIEGPREFPYARLSNGRQLYFCPVRCPTCEREYVAAVDFYEMQPARYIGSLRGVAGFQMGE